MYRFLFNLFPEFQFDATDVCIFRIALNLFDDGIYLFKLKIDDIVHHPHGCVDVFLEFLEVERSLGGKWFIDVSIEVDSQQPAAVVGAERNLAARIGRYGAESQIGIAVGDRLPDDRIPEEYAGFS